MKVAFSLCQPSEKSTAVTAVKGCRTSFGFITIHNLFRQLASKKPLFSGKAPAGQEFSAAAANAALLNNCSACLSQDDLPPPLSQAPSYFIPVQITQLVPGRHLPLQPPHCLICAPHWPLEYLSGPCRVPRRAIGCPLASIRC